MIVKRQCSLHSGWPESEVDSRVSDLDTCTDDKLVDRLKLLIEAPALF